MKKLFYKSLLLLPILGIIVGVNYTIDPLHLFTDKYYEELSRLTANSDVLVGANCDEYKLVKTLITTKQSPEVVVAGSSRSLIVGAEVIGVDNMVNISTSGADLEDLIGVLELFHANHDSVKKWFIAIDPWMLNANRGSTRFHRNIDFYNEGATKFNMQPVEVDEVNESTIEQLISLENFQMSLLSILDFGWGEVMPKAHSGSHPKLAVRTKTGALLYPSQWQTQEHQINIAAKRYISGKWVYGLNEFHEISKERLISLKMVLQKLKGSNGEVVVFFSPYHPMVHEHFQKDDYFKVVQEAQQAIQEVCRELNIRTIGNYDPNSFGLVSTDFYDGMHPNKMGLKKIIPEPVF